MLPIFAFLLDMVAMFIAAKVNELRSGLHGVPLAIIGPSHLLLNNLVHLSPAPESANYTAEEWLVLLGSVAYLITLASLWIIFIWVLVAHPSFLEEVHGKIFTSTVDTDDAPWSEQETRNSEEGHLLALKLKHATISLRDEKILNLESELRDLQASSTGKLKEVKSAVGKKLKAIKAENGILRVTLNQLELCHQDFIVEKDKKLASKEKDLLKLSTDSTRLIEEAKVAAAKKQQLIEFNNAALRASLHELELSHQAVIMEQDKKLASKEQDLLKLSASSTRLLQEAKSAAARKQSSIEADNVALVVILHELELSHQAVTVEQEKKLASNEEDLVKLRANSTRQLEVAESAATKKQQSIEADNAALRITLRELELHNQTVRTQQDRKLASKEEDLLTLGASSTRQLEEAKSAAAKEKKFVEAENAALRITLHELELSHQAATIEQDKKLASKEEDLLNLRASSTSQLEEAKSAAFKKQSSIEEKCESKLAVLRLCHAKEILELKKRGQRKLQKTQDDHFMAMSQAKCDLENITEAFERRQTTIEFSVVEEAVGSHLQSQLQHHSDYVTRLDRWLATSLSFRTEKLAGLRPKEVREQVKLSPPAVEAETRYCTEYLLFAQTEISKVRLPSKAQEAPESVPLPVGDDLDLLDPVQTPLPEDEDLNLRAPEWVPLPEDDDDDLDLLPDLPDGEDLSLAPKGPKTKPPTSANKGGRPIPPRGAPKAPKAMLALNAQGGPKHGSSFRWSSWSHDG